MPVKLFTYGLEPEDLNAVIWRFMNRRKFEDLLTTSELFFNRAGTSTVDNRVHSRPLTPPPDRVKDCHRRHVDLQALLTGVVVTPWAENDTVQSFRQLIAAGGYAFPVIPSELTRFRQLLP